MSRRVDGVALSPTWTPLSGVTIEALTRNGVAHATTVTTDAHGYFSLGGLPNYDWVARIASGELGHILLIDPATLVDQERAAPIRYDHGRDLDPLSVRPDQHHPIEHVADHQVGGAQALSLDQIAGTVSGPGHGDQTGEVLAVHAPTDLVGGTWRLFYSDGSGNVIELALGADGAFLRTNGVAAAPSFVGVVKVQATAPPSPVTGEAWLDTSTSGTGTESLALVTKTAAYTATDSDTVILCDATSAAFTITLPTAVGRTGKVLYIKKIDATVNAVTIDGDGAETIDGETTQVISTQYNALKLISDGSEWHIL